MAKEPALVLVHGAWHGGWAWEAVVEELRRRDVAAVVLDLPSARDTSDLRADAAVLREAVREIDGPVVAVGHSYGGQVISEGAHADDGVVRLVYLAAFQLEPGQSLLDALGGEVPPWIAIDEAAGVSRATRSDEIFYGDCTPEQQQWADAQLTPQSLASFGQPLSRAAWQDVPSTYVVAEQDQAIPPQAQEAMSGHADEVRRLASSHSPFLSQPAAVADLLVEVARGAHP